jgi:hypothetical protein
MKLWDIIIKVAILVIAVGVIGFDLLLYKSFENQKSELSSVKDKQDVEAEFNSNKFKFQQDQIDRISKDLEDAQKQLKEEKIALDDQNNSLIQEAQKRQQVEDDSKNVQTSLVDIKAEADAIKQDMKTWQKDYVSVLAELEKKMDASETETKALETNLMALNIPELKESIGSLRVEIEEMSHPANSVSSSDAVVVPPAVPDKTLEHDQAQ